MGHKYDYFVVEGMGADGSSDAGPEGRTLAEAKRAAQQVLKETVWADWVHVWGYPGKNNADYPDLLATFGKRGYKSAAKREAARALVRMQAEARVPKYYPASHYEALARGRQ